MSDYVVSTIIGELLSPGAIAPRVSVADKRQALGLVAEIAARAYGVKVPKVRAALMVREGLSSTGIGYGVAIPHAQIPGLSHLRGVFLRLNPAIDFGSVDEEPVDLIFALLSPPGAGPESLRTMARVARALRVPSLRQQLRQAGSADAIQALLVRDERPSAA